MSYVPLGQMKKPTSIERKLKVLKKPTLTDKTDYRSPKNTKLAKVIGRFYTTVEFTRLDEFQRSSSVSFSSSIKFSSIKTGNRQFIRLNT